MAALLAGIAVGIASPFQTGVNGNLNKRLSSPFAASFVSFVVGFLFLFFLVLIQFHNVSIPFSALSSEPAWIWAGGVLGVFFLTCNIILLPKLGSMQTVVFPVFGLMITGLIVDHFGLFGSTQISLTPKRFIGMLMAFAGVMIISFLKEKSRGSQGSKGKQDRSLWKWRLLGILAGGSSALQITINGYLGRCMSAPIKASLISFAIGVLALFVLLLILRPKIQFRSEEKYPWWIWIGGTIGAMFVFITAAIAPIIGTSMTAVATQTGQMAGGVLIDHFGLVRVKKNTLSIGKFVGLLLMLAGAVIIRF